MARDESSQAEGSLVNSGQMLEGGRAGPGESMTAPGSEPSAALDGSDREPAEPPLQDFRRTVHGQATRRGAAR